MIIRGINDVIRLCRVDAKTIYYNSTTKNFMFVSRKDMRELKDELIVKFYEKII